MIAYSEKFEAEAVAAPDVTNDSFGVDAALLNQKIEFGGHAFFDSLVRRLDKQPVDADIQDAGDVVATVAAPADPDVVRGRESGQCAAGIGRFLVQEKLPEASARR